MCSIPCLCALSQLGDGANGGAEPTLSPIPVLVGYFHVLLVNQHMTPLVNICLNLLSTHWFVFALCPGHGAQERRVLAGLPP